MMTEAGAKERWCPLARPIVPAIDKSLCTNGTLDLRCIGSACMAWRWGSDPAKVVTGSEQYTVDRGPGQENRYGFETRQTYGQNPDRRGYCGAFGKE